ncbi:hypothetical protein [Salinibacterium sp.]|uniref:hypothetical protein n=1 Tax=Salinibacterium sp. TaxID=1915057 RepID=UPI00286A1717|nr:hypothetical protein [Salinibacterium sp.]
MAGITPSSDRWIERLVDRLAQIEDQLRTLQQPTGTSILSLADQVKQALVTLSSRVALETNAYLSGGFSTGGNVNVTGSVNVTGPVAATGPVSGSSGTFGGSLASPGAASTDVSLIAGLRQNVWQLYTGGNTGLYGFAPSTREAKANITEKLPFTAAQVLACTPRAYQYRGQIALRDDPTTEGHDPDHVVPNELGMLAEDLIDNGLSCFVEHNEDGTPRSIDYVTFSAVALLEVVRSQQKQIDVLSDRITRLSEGLPR